MKTLYLFLISLVFFACSTSKNTAQNNITNSDYTQTTSDTAVNGGNTYITNNYQSNFVYDDYYDYSYTSRIRRFHNYNPYWSYYSPYYTNLYYYNYDPYYWGTSIYMGYNFWGPGYTTIMYSPYWGYNNWWLYNNWHYNNYWGWNYYRPYNWGVYGYNNWGWNYYRRNNNWHDNHYYGHRSSTSNTGRSPMNNRDFNVGHQKFEHTSRPFVTTTPRNTNNFNQINNDRRENFSKPNNFNYGVRENSTSVRPNRVEKETNFNRNTNYQQPRPNVNFKPNNFQREIKTIQREVPRNINNNNNIQREFRNINNNRNFNQVTPKLHNNTGIRMNIRK